MAENENRELDEMLNEEAENVDAAEDVTNEADAEQEVETALVPAEENKPAMNKPKETRVKKADEAKAKKPGIFIRIGRSLKRFWKSMKSELKRVTWINRKQTFTSTLLVLVCMAVSAVVIGLLDVGLSVGLEAIANLI